MSEVWHVLKKSLPCKPHSSEVHNPKGNSRCTQRKKHANIECSNVRDERNEKHFEQHVRHEIFLDRSSGEIKICPCCPCSHGNEDCKGVEESHPPRSTKRIISAKTYCVDCDECNVFSKSKKVPLEKEKKQSNDPPTSTRHHEFEEKLKSNDLPTRHHEGEENLNSIDTVEEHDNIPAHSGKKPLLFLVELMN